MSEDFDHMKRYFTELCERFGLKVPDIQPALPADPCDVTDPPYVRINLRQTCDRDYQVRHLFGHYLADLHAVEEGRYSNDVADVVARLIAEADAERSTGACHRWVFSNVMSCVRPSET